MKKTVLAVIVASGLSIFFTYYGLKSKQTINECDKPHKSNNDICFTSSNAPSKLSVGLISNMASNYQSNKKEIINNNLGIDDAHSIWFDLGTLKEFLYHIETTVKENSNGASKVDDMGVRVYYADYPAESLWAEEGSSFHEELSSYMNTNDNTKKYSGLHTLIMVPTLRVKGGEDKKGNVIYDDIDIDITNSVTYVEGLKGYFNEENMNNRIPVLSALSRSRSTSKIGAQNHGSMIPPADSDQEGF